MVDFKPEVVGSSPVAPAFPSFPPTRNNGVTLFVGVLLIVSRPGARISRKQTQVYIVPVPGLRRYSDIAPELSLNALSCSLTSCCDLSGESPDDGRFPVRPSSLTPSVSRRREAPKAGVTRYLRRRGGEHVTPRRRSQSGGLGKRAGRSMKRTMQRRNTSPVGDCWQRRVLWVATR